MDTNTPSATRKPRPFLPLPMALGIALLLVGGMTWAVLYMQIMVEIADETRIRPFGIAFVLLIAAMTFWGGRPAGVGTTVFAIAAMFFLVLRPAGEVRIRDIVELTLLSMVSLVVIGSIDSAQRQRARADQAREESEEARARLAAIMDTAPVAVLTCDTDGILDFANTEAERILGHPLPSAGKAIWQQYRIYDANGIAIPPDQTGISLALTQPGKVITHEVQIERPGETSVWVISRSKTIEIAPLTEGDPPALLGAVSAFVDVTRQKEVEEERARLLETLLLHRPAEVLGLDIATHYAAAQTSIRVGGDFYDVFPLDETRTALVVGDLSGKGVAAAAQVATVRNMLRYALYQGRSLAEGLSELNDMLSERRLVNGFASLCVLIYDPCTYRLVYASCGHEPGLLLRPSTNTVEELPPTGPVLGAFGGAEYTQAETILAPGDLITLYTDGISEAGRKNHEYLGSEGLEALLRSIPKNPSSKSALDHLIAGVDAFAPGPLHDDRCLLVALVRPLAAPPEDAPSARPQISS